MGHQAAAVETIMHQFALLNGADNNVEASLGIALGPILADLLSGLVTRCFPQASNAEVAQSLLNPTPMQEQAFKRQCRAKANKTIRRPGSKNPTGVKLTSKQRNRMRKQFAKDLYLAMRSSAETKGIDGVTELVKEMRA